MKEKKEHGTAHAEIKLKCILTLLLILLMFFSVAPSSLFASAEDLSSGAEDIFIGNYGVTAGLTIKQSVGYTVYSDAGCINAMSAGQLNLSTARELYIKANSGYTLNSIAVFNQSDYSASSVTAGESGGVFHLSFPTTTADHQFINVSYTLAGDSKAYTFDLSYGSVELGSEKFVGFNGAGLLMQGAYDSTNLFTVSQSGATTANTISISGGTFDVTLNGVNTSVSPGIRIPSNDAETDVTLRLSGTNTINQLFYFTGNYNNLNNTSLSSLTITSASGDGSTDGILNAAGSGWAAAIGGNDSCDDTLNINIKGGTIVATGDSSAAIGGGGNGAATIRISGGHVTATNNGNGAAIGGGGAITGNGGPAIIEITGGTVIATNNGNGAAIGGGSSRDLRGADATVNISGGYVTANSSTNLSSGIVIGGGSTDTGSSAGAAVVSITGGTVIANGTRGISGGAKTSDTSYAAASVTIEDGSYTGGVMGSTAQFESNGIIYKRTEVTLQNTAGNTVTGATVTSVDGSAMGSGVVTDNNGKIYLWQAESSSVTSAVANGVVYSGNIEAGESGVLVTAFVVEFYLDFGNVEITNATYSGFNIAGNAVTGTHNEGNRYIVRQASTVSPTENKIFLTGTTEGTAAVFDLTLDGINNATATNKYGDNRTGSNTSILTSGQHDTTLRLAGTNYIGRLHYSTSVYPVNKLTITSAAGDGSLDGTLYAESTMQWSAAIGGIDFNDEDAHNILIKGGTIIAVGKSSAAIGGGGNGDANITITGGSVTATNNGTGATIGGGGGNNETGGAGTVTITGGFVEVTNNSSNGNAIGGGGSSVSDGSFGVVNISGGYISIIGGVGGGNTVDGSAGGTAQLSVSGGTITATGHVGSGSNGANLYAPGSTIIVTGGSVNSQGGATSVPVNGNGGQVLLTVVQFTASTDIYSILLSDGSTYLTNDMKTDSDGKLYLFLPPDVSVEKINDTITSVSPTAIIAGSLEAGDTLTAILRDGTAVTYQWQFLNNGVWESIGTNSNTYTTSVYDVGKYVRVRITDNNSTNYESLYIVIAPSTAPSFIITIPESVNMNGTGEFNISGVLYNFAPENSLTVTVTSAHSWNLTGTKDEGNIGYTIYTDSGKTQAVTTLNNTAAEFTASGTKTLYYTVNSTAVYAGIYTDTLTFHVTLN